VEWVGKKENPGAASVMNTKANSESWDGASI